MGSRRKARELALQVLFSLDLNPQGDGTATVDEIIEDFIRGAEREYAERLINLVRERRGEIDEAISNAGSNWRLERMSPIERNILRFAAAEMMFILDVPYRVILNEAIEIANKYGTSESSGFVNGILHAIAVNCGRVKNGG